MKNKHFYIRIIASMFSIMLVAPAYANFSWAFDSNPAAGNCQAAAVGNTCTQSSTSGGKTIGVTASGWASSSNSTSSAFEQASLNLYDGLSVSSQGEAAGEPEHATDNDGKYESILYQFDASVSLETITIGWHKDSDLSLLRYTGTNPTSLVGLSYDTLTTNGWDLVGNYTYGGGYSNNADLTANVSGSTSHFSGPLDKSGNAKTIDTNNLNSSYWLITALNGSFWDHSGYLGNDYFKLKSFTGSYTAPTNPPSSVPEPSAIILILIGFIGWKFSNKTQRKNCAEDMGLLTV